ncbi:MAG: TRAP transporter large permease subunit, partial [Rhodospirillaceae bacterium]|nr:TRAP transporter large permease subunit [Rhodospirillaceae bacterium]
MEWYWILLALFGSILFLMFAGLPVGIAFIAVNTVAAFFIVGRCGDVGARVQSAIGQHVDNAFGNMAIFAIVPIPMFLLMGELFFHTGLANRMFNAVEKLMGRVPARLSYVTVAGGTAFATLSGSSMGSTALLGTLMVPEMTRRGYKKSMSIGPILGTGGLAMLIPPSALAVLLGTLAEIDIGKLLIAGVVPGLLLAVFYAILIFIRATLDPEAAPSYDVETVPVSQRILLFLLDVLPMISIIGFVIVLIMGGVATPSEAAAYGSVGVILLAVGYLFAVPLLRGDFRQALAFGPHFAVAMWKSLWGAGRVTVIALMILFGSSLFSNVLAASGSSAALIEWVAGFDVSPYVMLLMMFGILLLLGMFMDQLAMMLLTVPIYFPIVQGLEFGLAPEVKLIWFGVIMLLAMEIS